MRDRKRNQGKMDTTAGIATRNDETHDRTTQYNTRRDTSGMHDEAHAAPHSCVPSFFLLCLTQTHITRHQNKKKGTGMKSRVKIFASSRVLSSLV